MKSNTQLSLIDPDTMDPKTHIIIKNARVNNLKNLTVAIPRNKMVVITGVSGSGKSSLAFDTLFAEGQRMYVESLNSYARQFLGRMEKPDVDYIKGVSPAIAIEQKVSTRNPRSTVGTSTEIYDYLKLLFARIGKTFSPISGQEVKKDTVTSIVDWVYTHPVGTKLSVLAPLTLSHRTAQEELSILLQKGFTRIVFQGDIHFIEEFAVPAKTKETIWILIDRTSIQEEDQEGQFRMSDSVQTALNEGDGLCRIQMLQGETHDFSTRFELDGLSFEEPSINLFAFNNPYGACKTCEGYGHVLGIDKDKVIPNKNLSVYEGAIAPWKGEKMSEWLSPLVKKAIKFDFPVHRPYQDLSLEQQNLLWKGNSHFEGLDAFFKFLESQSFKIQYRVMLSRYRGRTACPDCKGTRLRKDAQYVKIEGHSITDLVLLQIRDVLAFFKGIDVKSYDLKVAQRILTEISNRLGYLDQVGLGYLTLNRLTNSLSGGEFQRIKLATSLGSALVGSMYVLDEPSIGLHPRDTQRLIQVLIALRDLGNTVIVVEHEEEVMKAADQIIDIGPDAGRLGGHLVAQFETQNLSTLLQDKELPSHTLDYLLGIERIEVPFQRRKPKHWIEVKGARENNLKNIHARFPTGVLTVVTGVSGSGKSTLIKKILFPALSKYLGGVSEDFTGKYDGIEGDLKQIKQIEFVDQNPIGKSSRSNPVTYTKAYDFIRNLMTEQPLSKQRAYKPAHFSFNVEGGRCETCQGEGFIKVEMQFMADVYLTCESCGGKRFKQEMLEVLYQDKNISDILDLTVDEALEFFVGKTKIYEKLKPLQDVGLGYIKLGQSSNTLSGGEAQRVKLATFLSQSGEQDIMFIFDEPTTGLHFHDISKLLKAINALVDKGNTVIIIEHNMEIIKCADYIIDLGPDGGDNGGAITFSGTPEEMVAHADSNLTAYYLKEKMI